MRDGARKKRSATGRRALRRLLESGRLDDIGQLAEGSRRVLGTLFALTFDADPLVAWRAIEANGIAAARIADQDPEPVRNHLRRLHWLLCEESGGIGWRAPETMAEIVCKCPTTMGDYIPIVVHLIMETAEEDLGHFRTGMLWAIGRLGELASGYSEVVPAVVGALDHADSQVRGVAVWTLGRLGRAEPLERRPQLGADEGAVTLFEDGALRHTTVGDVWRAALKAVSTD